jgi:hypothetical protein
LRCDLLTSCNDLFYSPFVICVLGWQLSKCVINFTQYWLAWLVRCGDSLLVVVMFLLRCSAFSILDFHVRGLCVSIEACSVCHVSRCRPDFGSASPWPYMYKSAERSGSFGCGCFAMIDMCEIECNRMFWVLCVYLPGFVGGCAPSVFVSSRAFLSPSAMQVSVCACDKLPQTI